MEKKSSAAVSGPRIPEASHGIQVNFCKLPTCDNYGKADDTKRAKRGRHKAGDEKVRYVVIGEKKPSSKTPYAKCSLCKEQFPLKSNQAIYEEVERLTDFLIPPPQATCPNAACPNHKIGIDAGKKAYQSFGRSAIGSQRYRCKGCLGTFSVGKATRYHKKPHKNKLVFMLLVNKSPLRRISEVAELHPAAVYGKIDFLYRRCLEFLGSRERRLTDDVRLERVYAGVDRQDHFINWTDRRDKRNVKLTIVSAADNKTSYVFFANLNYDPRLDPEETEKKATANGDNERKRPFRSFARLWLQRDYKDLMEEAQAKNRKHVKDRPSLDDTINSAYQKAQECDDIEVFEQLDYTDQLPHKGMQIHSEYTLYGSLFVLERLLSSVGKVRLFLDQDSGMRAAALGAFQSRIAERSCDVFYVSIRKNLTVDQRREIKKSSDAELKELMKRHPDKSESEVKLMLLKQRILERQPYGSWKDKFLKFPFPSMSEPEKAVCYLTDFGEYDIDHLAWLYSKASLHATDRFFMQVRRKLALLERPFATASDYRRQWYGYNPYNPFMMTKVVTIFRAYYNYCQKGEDGSTPAMRIGLAKGAVDIKDIIYGYP
jgi:transposase-like protein